jgi:hypothetical protein
MAAYYAAIERVAVPTGVLAAFFLHSPDVHAARLFGTTRDNIRVASPYLSTVEVYRGLDILDPGNTLSFCCLVTKKGLPIHPVQHFLQGKYLDSAFSSGLQYIYIFLGKAAHYNDGG